MAGPRSRRAGLLLAAMAVIATAAFRYVRSIAPYRPRLERISLILPAGHAALAGLRIGFITDTHVGPFITPADLERAVALLGAEQPDLVLLGGDYISESPRYADSMAATLADLVAAAPCGGFAVLGNHDVANDAAKVTAALATAGITVLRNRAVEIAWGSRSLWLAGIDEAILARSDLDAAFADVPPGAAVLALWHEPDYAAAAATRGAFAQLSGHSHGGQVRLPFLGAIVVPAGGQRYVIGFNTVDGMPVYTARGVGVYRPPIRLHCPPEVTLVTLTDPAWPGGPSWDGPPGHRHLTGARFPTGDR